MSHYHEQRDNMNKFTNQCCGLKDLRHRQVSNLVGLMPKSTFFNFSTDEKLIGFFCGDAGTWLFEESMKIISYSEMLALLGADEEYPNPPLPHMVERIAFAKGADIEFYDSYNKIWWFVLDPSWHEDVLYRVQPPLSSKQIKIDELQAQIDVLKGEM